MAPVRELANAERHQARRECLCVGVYAWVGLRASACFESLDWKRNILDERRGEFPELCLFFTVTDIHEQSSLCNPDSRLNGSTTSYHILPVLPDSTRSYQTLPDAIGSITSREQHTKPRFFVCSWFLLWFPDFLLGVCDSV